MIGENDSTGIPNCPDVPLKLSLVHFHSKINDEKDELTIMESLLIENVNMILKVRIMRWFYVTLSFVTELANSCC